MTPRADFLCQPCFDSGRMPAPVELPVMSRRCPLCGKARGLQRIWSGASSNPGVISADRHAKSRFTTPLLEKDWDKHQAIKDAGIQGRTRETPALAVPISQAMGMINGSLGGSTPQDRPAHPVLARALPPRPADGSKRWAPPPKA